MQCGGESGWIFEGALKIVHEDEKAVWNRRDLRVLILSVALGFSTGVQAKTAQELFVAPDGDDRSAGTVNAPLQSIERAHDIVRTMNASIQQDIVVYPRGGTYRLNKTLMLDERDSGNNGWRVIYQSYPGERAILSGGTVISGVGIDGRWGVSSPYQRITISAALRQRSTCNPCTTTKCPRSFIVCCHGMKRRPTASTM